MTSERSEFQSVNFCFWVSRYVFIVSGVSKIALVFDYDLLERSKLESVLIFFHECQNTAFLSKVLKIVIVLDYEPIGGHILASKWPLREEKLIAIFDIFDPKYLYLDIHKANIDT